MSSSRAGVMEKSCFETTRETEIVSDSRCQRTTLSFQQNRESSPPVVTDEPNSEKKEP